MSKNLEEDKPTITTQTKALARQFIHDFGYQAHIGKTKIGGIYKTEYQLELNESEKSETSSALKAISAELNVEVKTFSVDVDVHAKYDSKENKSQAEKESKYSK